MSVPLPPPEFRIHDLVRQHLAQHAHRSALIDAGRLWRYGELFAAAQALADHLRRAGLRPGDRLMVVGENSASQVLALLAASLNDSWAVMCNARQTGPELQAIEAHCGPRLVLYTTAASVDAARHAQARGARADGLPGVPFHLTDADPLAIAEPCAADAAEQVAVLIYTTGTTGQPKGVMLTHRNLGYSARVSAQARAAGLDDDVYAALPLSHVFGLTSVVLAALSAGARVRLAARFDARYLAQALADGISFLQGVPAMFVRLLELHAQGVAVPAPRLRYVQCGGAPMDASIKDRVEALFGLPINNGYGMTEASPSISMVPYNHRAADLTVGFPIPRLETRILDEAGRPVAPGEVGELSIRGPNVTRGYYRAPDETAQVLGSDGWFATGDLLRQADDGRLYVMGRRKELIIRSGFNVYPAEVEAALNSHPAVAQSCVVGHWADGDEQVIAFVEPRPGSSPDTDALAAHVRERLAPYKRPAHIAVVPQLPAAQSGKVLRKQVQALAAELRG